MTDKKSFYYILLAAALALWSVAFYILQTNAFDLLDYSSLKTEGFEPVKIVLSLSVLFVLACLGYRAVSENINKQRPADNLKLVLPLLFAFPVLLLHFLGDSSSRSGAGFSQVMLLVCVTGIFVYMTFRTVDAKELGITYDTVSDKKAFAVTIVITLLFIFWWYCDALAQYDAYILGYSDTAYFARRLINTWEGRAFMKHSMHYPAFWDHFCPAIGIFLPVCAISQDMMVFILINIVCLAVPAVLIYRIVRALGGSPVASLCWSLAYLCFPVVGLKTTAFSYGFHAVSCALPFVFGSLLALIKGKKKAALGLLLFACLFKENVILFLTVTCFGCLFYRLLQRKFYKDSEVRDPFTSVLGIKGWAAVTVLFAGYFFFILRFTLVAEKGASKFAYLGTSKLEILFSPFQKPELFWPNFIDWQTMYFFMALLLPLGIYLFRKTWPIMIFLLIPLGALFVYRMNGNKSIAFQYTTIPLAVIFMSAWVGCLREENRKRAFLSAGFSALAGCVVFSACLGNLPWSSDNCSFPASERRNEKNQVHYAVLDTMVEKVLKNPKRSILCTDRIAGHLYPVKQLDPLNIENPNLPSPKNGNKYFLDNYDVVAIDTFDIFSHSPKSLGDVALAAEVAGFSLTAARNGALLYERNSNEQNLLPLFVITGEEKAKLMSECEPSPLRPEIDCLGFNTTIERHPELEYDILNVGVLLLCKKDNPPLYGFVHSIKRGAQVLYAFELSYLFDGTRYTSWMKKGDVYRHTHKVPLPKGIKAAELEHYFSLSEIK